MDSGDDHEKPLVAQEMLREMASLATLQQQQQQQQPPKDDSKSPSRLQGLLQESPDSRIKERLTLPITILPSSTPIVVMPNGNVGQGEAHSQGQGQEDSPVVSTQQEDTGHGRKPRKGTPMKIPDSSSVNGRHEDTNGSPDVVVLADDSETFFTETEMMGGVESKALAIPQIRASRTPILPRSNQRSEILDLSAKKAEKVPSPDTMEPQILLLNGKEYEIVSLGNGRWISRNEYELMHALGTVMDNSPKDLKDGKAAASPDSTQEESQQKSAAMKRKLSADTNEEPPVKQAMEEKDMDTALDLTSKPTALRSEAEVAEPKEEKSEPVNLSAKTNETIDKVKKLAEAVADGDMNVRQALLKELLKTELRAKSPTSTSSTTADAPTTSTTT